MNFIITIRHLKCRSFTKFQLWHHATKFPKFEPKLPPLMVQKIVHIDHPFISVDIICCQIERKILDEIYSTYLNKNVNNNELDNVGLGLQFYKY